MLGAEDTRHAKLSVATNCKVLKGFWRMLIQNMAVAPEVGLMRALPLPLRGCARVQSVLLRLARTAFSSFLIHHCHWQWLQR